MTTAIGAMNLRRDAGLAAEVRASFRKAYVEDAARIETESQGAYALALDFELFDPAEQARAA